MVPSKFIYKGLTIVLAIVTILLCFQNIRLKSNAINQEPLIRVDTVFIDSPIIIKEPKNSDEVLPNKVIMNHGIISENNNKDSLVQFTINKNQLSISTINPDSVVTTNNFTIDLDKYRYTYNNNILYQKRKLNLKLKPFIEAKYLYFNSMVDVNGGIDLKTNHLTYSLGINLCYNTKANHKLNPDLYLAIKYTF